MKCICKNCKHCLNHADGTICGRKLVFVRERDYCLDFDTKNIFNPVPLILVAILFIMVLGALISACN